MKRVTPARGAAAAAMPAAAGTRQRILCTAQRGDQGRAGARSTAHAEIALPQLAQNLAPGEAAEPHCVQ